MRHQNILALAALALTGFAVQADTGAPDAFSFIERSNVPTSSFVTSESKTLSGYANTLDVSVSGGGNPQYSIDGAAFTNSASPVAAGHTLTVRHMSAATVSTVTTSIVSVGSYTASFRSTTTEFDRTPDDFSFGNQGNVAADTDIESVSITLSGYTAPAPIVPGANVQYRIGSGLYTSASGSLPVGATLTLKHRSSPARLGYTKSTVKVGGVTGYFTTRTKGNIAPASVNDQYSVDQDTTLTVAAPGVLANDTNSKPLTASIASAPAMGTVSLAANGGFTYTPRTGFFGSDQFSYTNSDGTASSAAATVRINVKFVPAPVRLTLRQFGSGTPGRTFTLAPAGACATVVANAAYDCKVDSIVTITAAAPPAGTYFAGWFDAPECASKGLDGGNTPAQPYKRDCTISINAARTVQAAFATTPSPSQTSEADAVTCDVTVSQHCFYPFPNNVFTKAKGATDVSSYTGLQVNLVTAGHFPNASSTGKPATGKTLDATEWNRDDGFPQGPKLLTFINTGAGSTNIGADENDLDATGVTHIVDLSRSLLPTAPVMILDATPKVDASGNPCSTGASCLANLEYLKPVLNWVEPELPKRELRDTDANGMMDTRVIPDAERALTIRLGTNLHYRHRYVVALRRFKRADGSYIEAEPNFRIYRDNQTLGASFPNMSARRAGMENIFGVLAAAGIARADLNQAWDFTVISSENLHERLLAMRDTANTALGATSIPCYTVEKYPNASDLPPAVPPPPVSAPYTSGACAAGTIPAAVPGNAGVVDSATGEIARTVDGTVAVPCYMTNDCAPGSKLNYTPGTPGQDPVFGDNKPDAVPGSFLKANWECRIPRSATGTNPARISLYGHGLLGGLGEVRSGHVSRMANENNIIFCAMNWTGFATEDAGAVVATGADISAFAPFIDRQLEGHLAWLIFQELIVRDGGFINHPAFRTSVGCAAPATSCPLYHTEFDADGNGGMFYDGNSQGGIMAGAVVAISKRITHAVLGVPGMNYSLLLRRSSDFQLQEGQQPGVGATAVNYALQVNYPNDLDLAFIYALTPMVWERTENSGFAVNMTDNPLPNSPRHKILLTGGYGDHQVTMWTNDIMARSAGMSVIKNMTNPARYALSDPHSGSKYGVQKPHFGIPEISSFPFNGSAWTVWDSGTAVIDNPPLYNAPPRTNQDPHEHVRRAPDARAMKSAFLHANGAVVNTCSHDSSLPNEGPCSSANHD